MIASWILYLINIVVLLIILVLPPDGLSYLKTFLGIILVYNIPGYLLLKALGFLKKKEAIYTKFITSLVTGFSLWFIPLFIFSQFKIPIPSTVIYTVVAISLVIFLLILYNKTRKRNILKQIKISKLDVIMITLFNILLFVYITPIKGLLVAPLHDPAAISVYAKKLIDNKYILTQLPQNILFYPPGGYFFVGLISDLMKLDPSKVTMIVTNICNVLIGFSFATLLSTIFKKRKSIDWISTFVFSLISIYPAYLYFTAGKNAQIIAYVFLFSSLYFFYRAIGDKITYKLLFGLIVVSSVLLHYNNLLTTVILCISIYVYKLIKDKYSFKKIFKDLLGWFSILLVVGVLLYLQLEILRDISYFYSSILAPLEPDESFSGIIGMQEFLEWFLPMDSRVIANRNSIVVLILGLLSSCFLFIKFGYDFIKKKYFNKGILFIFLFMILFYLALYIELGAITRHFKFNKLFLFLIPISYVLSLLFDKGIRLYKKFKLNYLLILIFLLVGGWNMYTLYQRYISARFVSPVRQEDLDAFEWLDENIPDGSYVIPAHIQTVRSYVLDSSLYMKAYTDNYELFAFVKGKTPDNHRVLSNTYLALESNPEDRELLEKFTSSDIYYIFSGSHKPWGCGELPCGFFDDYPEIYEVVYDVRGVRVYKIVE